MTGTAATVASSGGVLSLRQVNADEETKRIVFAANRDDQRFQETAGFLHNLMKTNPPKLAFDPDMTREEYPAWQNAIRERLLELMAFPELQGQPAPKRLWIRKREGYQVQKWEAYPEPGCVVPFMMVVPDGVSRNSPGPAVMCFPGSGWSLESLVGEPEVGRKAADNVKNKTDWKWQDNRMALHFAKRGMIGVAVANPATNDTDSTIRNRTEVSLNAILLGRCYLGISAFQKAHILEWVSQQTYVDRNRLAVCGHSLGSEPADVLGVLYPDLIKAVIHNDFCCNWIERSIALNGLVSPAWHLVPGMYKWFDATDLEASIAPRPLLFTEGGRANQLAKIEAAYRLNNAAQNMQVYQYKKYTDPAARVHDFKPLPEGLSVAEYLEYANVDAQNHCFRPTRAVPWLENVFANL
ncbi:MAG: alpha/beta hydrolase family protein [Fuerstiella sp.]